MSQHIFLDSMQTDEQPADYKLVAHSLDKRNVKLLRRLSSALRYIGKMNRICRRQGKELKRLRREAKLIPQA